MLIVLFLSLNLDGVSGKGWSFCKNYITSRYLSSYVSMSTPEDKIAQLKVLIQQHLLASGNLSLLKFQNCLLIIILQ